MERLDISDNILPIVSVAMYGTRLEPNNYADNYYERLEDDGMTIEEIHKLQEREVFDHEKWNKDIIKLASAIVLDEWLPMVKKYGVLNARDFSIHSPRYYNFENDELYFTLELEDDWEEKVLAAFKEAWETDESVRNYAKENYTSCSGFDSFTSNNYEDLSKMETMQDKMAVLWLVTMHDGYDNVGLYEKMCEDVWEQMDYGDYVSFLPEPEEENK